MSQCTENSQQAVDKIEKLPVEQKKTFWSKTDWRQYTLAAILFLLLASVVIGKALFLDNCYAYDTNDDINHTFTGLYSAKLLLKSGAMPFINYYNNFGTPLMGDALTHPFALQSIPYYLADIEQYPLVATINKFVLCFLTLTALLIYYRTFNFSIFTSSATAICVFFNFPHFWFFAHHHYQATLIFTVSIFIAQKAAIHRESNRLLFGSVAALFGLMIYSVSANLIVLCTPFFLFHPLFLRPTRKAIATNILALFAGGLLGSVQIIATAAAAMNSARLGTSFSESFLFKFSWSEMVLKLFYYMQFAKVQFCHIDVATNFPVILILVYGAGIYSLYRNDKTAELSTTITLGLVPTLPIFFMLVHTELWKALPILKSTDITRILWITMIFIGIGIGYFIEAAQKRMLYNRLTLGMLAVQFAATIFAGYLVLNQRIDSIVLFGYGFALMSLSLIAFRNRIVDSGSSYNNRISTVAAGLLIITILLTYFPIVKFVGVWGNPKQCRSWNYFSDRFDISIFRKNAERIVDSGRFALDVDSGRGYELQIEMFGRHGGGGRSIMMDKTLKKLLTSRDITANDDPICGYHFTNPWNASTANRLGLRYFGTMNQEQHENWQLFDQWGDFYIYENQQKPTFVSLRDQSNNYSYIDQFRIAGNDLIINLPKNSNGGKLLIAMTVRPGFSVTVDGAKRMAKADEFGFFNLDVSATDKTVKLSYNPLDLRWLL